MASFRILNQAPQYLLADGSVNAGGKLFMYETDLSTPKDTWSDEAMSTLNSNPVVMDAAGRTLTDVWGDGEYGVVMADADDVVIWTRNNVKASNAEPLAIPALQDGEFLTNNGSILQWQSIIQVPDPTGQSGEVLYSDGTIAFWGPLPETPDPPDPEIVVTPGTVPALYFQAGTSADNTKMVLQCGTQTCAASLTNFATDAVTFDTPFDAAPVVTVTPTGGVQPGGQPTFILAGAPSASGFTIRFDVAEGSGASANITSPIPYNWIAVGTREVAP